MASKLDDILDRMMARSAEGMQLKVGELPAVVAAGELVPIKKTPLTEPEWELLLREVAPPLVAERLGRRQTSEFTYRGYVFRATFDTGVASCDVRLENKPKNAASPELSGLEPSGLESSGLESSGLELGASPGPVRPVPVAGSAVPPRPVLPSVPEPVREESPDVPAWQAFVRDNKKLLIVAVLALAMLLSVVLWWTRPVKVPNIVMKDSEGQLVSLDDMRDGKDYLLLVFLVPNCSITRFTLDTIKTLPEGTMKGVSVAGLYFGTQSDADRHAKDQELTYPLYGLKDAHDPFAINDMIKKVGVSGLLVSGVYGGTVVLVDADRKVIFRLEKEEVRKLPDTLASAVD